MVTGIGYSLDSAAFHYQQRQEIILFLKSSDQLWDPPGLLFYGYQGPFCQGQSIQAMNMTIHFHPGPRLRMGGAVHPLPLCAFMICRGTTSFNLLCTLPISWWTACFLPNVFGKVNVQKIQNTLSRYNLTCQIEVRKITRSAFSQFRNRFCC